MTLPAPPRVALGRCWDAGGTQRSPCAYALAQAGRRGLCWQQPQGSLHQGCASPQGNHIPSALPATHPWMHEEREVGLGIPSAGVQHPRAAWHPQCPGISSLPVSRSGRGPWCYRQREQPGPRDPASCWVWALGLVRGAEDPGDPGHRAPGWRLGTSTLLCTAENLFCVSCFSLQRRFLSRSLVLYTTNGVAAFCPL